MFGRTAAAMVTAYVDHIGTAVAVSLALIGCLLTNGGVRANAVDNVEAKMDNITASTCQSAPPYKIYIRGDAVSHAPRFRARNFVQQKNRTSLQYAYNIAVNRALFLSAIYAMTNSSNEFRSQPGIHYIYMSEAANVLAASEDVIASGLFFHPNRSYPNWLPPVSFNETLPLFAVRASRGDNSRLVNVKDLGNTPETQYTNSSVYRQNEFIRDRLRSGRWASIYHRLRAYHMTKHGSGGTTNTVSFLGPGPNSYQINEPARVSRPYFDCGQTNQWLVPASSDASELLPRYTWWTHLRRYLPIATSTVDVKLQDLDVNVCPMSIRNEPPNYYAGIADCPSAECKVLPGQGLSDQGYSCCTEPGCAAEQRITTAEFTRGQSELNQADPATCSGTSGQRPVRQLSGDFWDMGDLQTLFEVQGRTGLRLAHFLSNFLQNNDPADNQRNVEYIHQMWNDFFANRPTYMTPWGPARNMTYDLAPQPDSPMRYVTVDQNLDRKWIEAEVFSTIMADAEIMSAGIFLEPGVFPGTNQSASAMAWKPRVAPSPHDIVSVGHVADVADLGENFTSQEFYTRARADFHGAANADKREEFHTTATVRTAYTDQPRVQAVPGQMTYLATDYETGHWLPPYFRCDERFADWTVSFVAPIFAKQMTSGAIDFGGVVKVDVYFTENHLFSRTTDSIYNSDNMGSASNAA